MAIIECKECKHIVSDKATTCPNCGAPVIKRKANIKEDLTELTIKKEGHHPLNIAIYIIFFLILLIISLYDITLINTYRNSYSLIAAQNEQAFQSTANLYTAIIINSTFISCILTIISKKTYKLSKITYIINLIAHILFFHYIYSHNFRVDIQYFLLFILNIIFLLLPRVNKIIEINKIEEIENVEKINKKNEELKEYYSKKTYTKNYIITLIILITLALIPLLVIYIKNKEPIIHETIIQEGSDYQIEITNDFINVREETSSRSNKLGEVREGDIYNVLDVIGGDNYIWYKINYKETIGYISSERTNPYVKELYADKLIVNFFCDSSKKCTNLYNKLVNYQTKNNTFLINYLNIKNNDNQIILEKLNLYFEEESQIPYITIGTERIHSKNNIYNEIIVNINNPIDKEYNLVDLIKKDNELPQLKPPMNESSGSMFEE